MSRLVSHLPPDPPGDRLDRHNVDSETDYALIALSDSGCITRWNPGAERVLGWTAQEMVGQSIHRIFLSEFVAKASAALADAEGESDMLARLARIATEHFADLCVIFLDAVHGLAPRVVLVHRDPQWNHTLQALDLGRAPGQGALEGWSQAVAGGQSLRVADLQVPATGPLVDSQARRQDLLLLGLRSCVAVPLRALGQQLGAICFASGEANRHYTEDDLVLAADLARRAALALQNARLLQALRDADRIKDVFLVTLAHELRNPLAPIANGLSIIERAPDDRPRVQQVCVMISRQVQQLTRLVDDLLDVSRIATGKIQITPQVTNLVSILGAAVEMSRSHFEMAQHQLVLPFTQEPIWVLADPARLTQVFTNLLNNAAKYTPRGGRIEVLVQVLPEEVVVRVRDNGVGIEPQMLRLVFGLFTQGQQPGDQRAGGLGIGLSLVDGLVRLHGGRVEAHSTGLDQGSEFIVYQPRRVPAGPDGPPARAQGEA
jgi:signal transduction histidine kinase